MANLHDAPVTVVVDGYGKQTLDPSDRLGSGTVGSVYRMKLGRTMVAAKVFFRNDPRLGEKVEYMVGMRDKWKLPGSVKNPLLVLRDSERRKAEVSGFVMELLSDNPKNLGVLADQTQSDNLQVTQPMKARLFSQYCDDLAKIHASGLTVVDLSANNVMFTGTTTGNLQPAWVDFESWFMTDRSFGEQIYCTPEYADPKFYDPETGTLIAKPTSDNDWYSLSYIVFLGLTYLPPYSGYHPYVYMDFERIKSGIWVGKSDVKVATGYSLEVLSDDLLHRFDEIFSHKTRDPIESGLQVDFADSLIVCPSCGVYYPGERSHCPICQVESVYRAPAMITAVELVSANGPIQFVLWRNQSLIALAYENQALSVYVRESGAGKQTRRIVANIPVVADMQFELVGESVIAYGDGFSDAVSLYDYRKGKQLAEVTTDRFLPNGKLAFRGTSDGLVRIVQDTIQKFAPHATFRDVWSDTTLPASALRHQTWLWADSEKPRSLVLHTYKELHLVTVQEGGGAYPVSIPQIDYRNGESLVDMTARFGSNSVVIRRITKMGTSRFVRTEVIKFGDDGPRIALSKKLDASIYPNVTMRGYAYEGQNGKYYLWHPSDQGIVREEVDGANFEVLEKSQGICSRMDKLIHVGYGKSFGKHFLLRQRTSVLYLVFK